MIKLLALDIDGTILKRDYSLSPAVKKTIQAASSKGVRVVLVTGRMYSSATFIAEELELDTPILSYSGAFARSKEEVFYEKFLEDSTVRKILFEVKNFDAQVNLYMDDVLYSESETLILRDYCQKRKLSYVIKSFDEISNIKATKLLAIGATPEIADAALLHLNDKLGDELCAVKSLPTFCEIMNKDASKGSAILFLAKKWGVLPEEIMAAGDQDNDIDLLKVAGVKVSMGNGTTGLKAVANYIAPSVEDDGLAVAIEKFILKEN